VSWQTGDGEPTTTRIETARQDEWSRKSWRDHHSTDHNTEKHKEVFWKRRRSTWEKATAELAGEEPGTAKWRLKLRLRLLYHERRKEWIRKEMERRWSYFPANLPSTGDDWRSRLFGPEYSSDNAGDGPKGRKRLKPSKEAREEDYDDTLGMPLRDRRLLKAHRSKVNQQINEGQTGRIIPTRQQFCKKLAQLRTSSWNPNEADIEQYIQQHPFTDLSEDSEHQPTEHNPSADGWEDMANSSGDELLFTIEALEREENVSEQGQADQRPSLTSIFDGYDLRWVSEADSMFEPGKVEADW